MESKPSVKSPLRKEICDTSAQKIHEYRYVYFTVLSNLAWFLNVSQNDLHKIVGCCRNNFLEAFKSKFDISLFYLIFFIRFYENIYTFDWAS